MSPFRRLDIWSRLLLFRKFVDSCHKTTSYPLSIRSYYSFRCNLASSRIPFSDLKRAEAFCLRMKWRQHEHTWTSNTWIWSELSTGLSSLHHATKSYGVDGGNLHIFINSTLNWINCSAPLSHPVVLPIENYWKLTSTIPYRSAGGSSPNTFWFNHYAS